MKKWEYLVVELSDRSEDTELMMDFQGGMGWELVQVAGGYSYFKKQLVE